MVIIKRAEVLFLVIMEVERAINDLLDFGVKVIIEVFIIFNDDGALVIYISMLQGLNLLGRNDRHVILANDAERQVVRLGTNHGAINMALSQDSIVVNAIACALWNTKGA